MGLQLIAPAGERPVSVEQAKLWCRIDGDDEDELLADLVLAATNFVEEWLGRSLLTQSWALTLDAFGDQILLPRGPVQEITEVGYSDAAGADQVLSDNTYTLDAASDPQWLVRNSAAGWPATQAAINAVRIRYSAGFGNNAAAVPGAIRVAIKQLVAIWYDDRGAARDEMPAGVAGLLWSHKAHAV